MKVLINVALVSLLIFMRNLVHVVDGNQPLLHSELESNNDSSKIQPRTDGRPTARTSKFFSMFQVVRFENSNCTATTGEIGTCYTNKDCMRTGGKSFGNCAFGFGVCCVASTGCGGQSAANNSYFVGPDTMGMGPGSCHFKILGDPDICQYRLNFERFNIAPPKILSAGICQMDQFSVSGAIADIQTICGTNHGQHVIAQANGKGNDISLTFTGVSTFVLREWRIRVIKYSCDYPHLAPMGCLQYFTGVTGTIQSFNFLPNFGGNKLAFMTYSVCIRNEIGFCGICYTQCPSPDQSTFSISGQTRLAPMNNLMGPQNPKSCSDDYVLIPCGGAAVQPEPKCGADRFCGGALSSTMNMGVSPSMPVCSVQRPFRLSFVTDEMEPADHINTAGFCLRYEQKPCTS